MPCIKREGTVMPDHEGDKHMTLMTYKYTTEKKGLTIEPALGHRQNADQPLTRALPYLPLHITGACQQEDTSTSTYPATQPHARADARDSRAGCAPSHVVRQRADPNSGKNGSRIVAAREHASRDLHSRATLPHHNAVFQPPTEGVGRTRWW